MVIGGCWAVVPYTHRHTHRPLRAFRDQHPNTTPISSPVLLILRLPRPHPLHPHPAAPRTPDPRAAPRALAPAAIRIEEPARHVGAACTG